jgi:hypothetical protein
MNFKALPQKEQKKRMHRKTNNRKEYVKVIYRNGGIIKKLYLLASFMSSSLLLF